MTTRAAIVVVSALAFLALGACAKEERQLISGRLTLTSNYDESSPCAGTGPYAETKAGYALVMREGTGDRAMPLDTAELAPGRITPYGCEFTFSFRVPPGMKQYTVFRCEYGEECQTIGYTWEELAEADFTLTYCRGRNCGGALDPGSDVGGGGGGADNVTR